MIKLYNQNMDLLQILHNAFNISYTQKLNELSTANFSMPYNDPKVNDCIAFNYVEFYDKNERIDLFRIMPVKSTKTANSTIINFQCEHVLATLLDDIIFGYSLLPSSNDTSDIINAILAYQSTSKWVLDVCDFAENLEYKLENNNLLNAIFQVPKLFTASYKWEYDTSTYPWELSLKELPTVATCRILYKINLIGMEKYEDPTELVTRLYGLGSGEGINQINVSSVNSGDSYIDSANISTYGIISKIFTDTNILTPDELLAKMQAILSEKEIPKVSYTVNSADIYSITGETLDHFVIGDKVQVDDSELVVSFSSIVTGITKNNFDVSPGNITVEISNKVNDINNVISNLEAKASDNILLSQGSSCIDSISIQENCDKTLTGVLKFFLNADVVFVNKCILNYEIDKFRAYEKSIASGGGSTSGASSASSSGASSSETTADGGGETVTTSITNSPTFYAGAYTSTNSEHSHDVNDHEHGITTSDHTHDMEHTHNIEHTHEISAHNHAIDYGIYEFAYLPPFITLKVDGNVVSGVTGLSGVDIDILPYLNLTGGKVSRSTFHTVEIIPGSDVNNPNGLCRIISNISWKQFIRNNSGNNL